MPWGMMSTLVSGTPYVSRRICAPLRAITTRRSLRRSSSSITFCCAAFGSRSTVCSVVTTGIRTSLSKASRWLPADPP